MIVHKSKILILVALAVFLPADLALASEVTGVISTGLTGTVNELIGTVIDPAPPTSGGGGSYFSGGGGSSYALTPVLPIKPLVLGVSTFRFTKTLKIGSNGNDVLELQKKLKAEGFFTGPITGYFGNLTKKALMAYQKKNKLPQNGTLYLKVRNKLNS